MLILLYVISVILNIILYRVSKLTFLINDNDEICSTIKAFTFVPVF